MSKELSPTASFLRSDTKQQLRELIADHCPDYANVLTLAGPFGRDARLLIERKHAKVTSIEHSKRIFRTQVRNTKGKSAFTPIKGEVNEVLPILVKHYPPFEVVFLDFCGPYGPANEKSLETVISSKLLLKNGLLAITFMIGREARLNDTRLCTQFLEQGTKGYLENRVLSIEAMIQHLARESRTRYSPLIKPLVYRNRKQEATEMMLFFYKRVK